MDPGRIPPRDPQKISQDKGRGVVPREQGEQLEGRFFYRFPGSLQGNSGQGFLSEKPSLIFERRSVCSISLISFVSPSESGELFQARSLLLRRLPRPPAVPVDAGGAARDPGGLGAVLHAQELVGGAKVLFYGRLGQEKPPGYLGVGQAIVDEL